MLKVTTIRARSGVTLVSALFASCLLALTILGAYRLVSGFFSSMVALDNRNVAENLSLNLQERFFHDDPERIQEVLGSGDVIAAMERDPLLKDTLPMDAKQLKGKGFGVRVTAMDLEQGDGKKGMHFVTTVTWKERGFPRSLSHSRLVASGLATPAAELATAAAAPEEPKPPRKVLIPLQQATSESIFGGRAKAIEYALAGKGRAAGLVFTGSEQAMQEVRGQVAAGEESARASTANAEASFAATGAGRGEAEGRGTVRGIGEESVTSVNSRGDSATAAKPVAEVVTSSMPEVTLSSATLTPAQRSVEIRQANQDRSPEVLLQFVGSSMYGAPRTAPERDEALVLELQEKLEATLVPPGLYRYRSVDYLVPRVDHTVRYEVFRLTPTDGSPAPVYPMVARQELRHGGMTQSWVEGRAVLETSYYKVGAAYPGGPAAPEGTIATFERCEGRLYFHRPAFLPDGSLAPFGREIAVVALDQPESVEAPGRTEVEKRWVLTPISGPGAVAKATEAQSTGGGGTAVKGHTETLRAPGVGGMEIVERPVEMMVKPSARAYQAAVGQGSSAGGSRGDAVEDRPDFLAARRLLRRGEFDQALGALDELRRELPDAPEVQRLIATTLLSAGRMEEAVARLRELTSGPDPDPRDINTLAFAEIHRGNFPAALEAVEQVLKIQPDHLRAHLNKGIALEFMGQRDRAADAFRKGLELHPTATNLKEGLQRVTSSAPAPGARQLAERVPGDELGEELEAAEGN